MDRRYWWEEKEVQSMRKNKGVLVCYGKCIDISVTELTCKCTEPDIGVTRHT